MSTVPSSRQSVTSASGSSRQFPAVAYIRRSTTGQEESLSIQRDVVQRYAHEHGYRIDEWFEDDGLSGDDDKRPGFNALIQAAERDDFRFILVVDLSRFSRFKPVTAMKFIGTLDDCDVRLVTTDKGPIDPDDLPSLMMALINAHGSKEYLLDLSRRTIDGQVKRAKDGHSAGQKAPFGMDRMYVDEEGKHRQRVKQGEKFAKPETWRAIFVPSDNPDDVKLVQWMFETYAGTSTGCRGIADQLNQRGVSSPNGGEWNKGTIRAILHNRKYMGDFVWNQRREGKHRRLTEGKAVQLATEMDGWGTAESLAFSQSKSPHLVFADGTWGQLARGVVQPCVTIGFAVGSRQDSVHKPR